MTSRSHFQTAPTTGQPTGEAGMPRSRTLLFAVAGGAAVGNLYWAQPLLGTMARSLHVSTSSAGLLVTLTQIGYALGVFLVVPLGDTRDRRRLIPAIMGISALGLAACAAAPSFAVLLVTLAAVGLTTVTGQLLAPLAGDLATDEERGTVVGTVAAGLLTGILISRTISGLITEAFGWRTVFGAAAVVTAILAGVLLRSLPLIPTGPHVPYGSLLRSVFSVVRAHRAVPVTLVLGATAFCVFSMFWTGLTFLLTARPFSYSVNEIGLVGLAGLAGALAAQRAGRLHDRGWSVPGRGAALLLAVVALLIAQAGAHSIAVILVAVVLFDVAIQAINVLNQTRLFSIDLAARSRLNTAFVTSNFIGGAVGSALAGLFWQLGEWSALTGGGALLITLALAVWAAQRRRL